VYLGRTATPRQERIFASEGRAYEPGRLMQPEDIAAMVAAALRLPRRAEVVSLTMRPSEKTY
jgi:NADP-dependent 3-hydroxy acid dehydrogenase YdfG